MTPIRQVVIVVPACDEEELLEPCLDSLAVASRNSPVPVRTIIVLDSCSDASADICDQRQIETVEVAYANVGRARHAGITRAVESQMPASSVWVANTDADSRVPPNWVTEQVRLGEEGADVVLGLADAQGELAPSLLKAHQAAYERWIRPTGSHGHIHGANLGIRASTYLEAGGFPPLTDHEDRQLVRRVRAMGSALVVSTTTLRVETSGRSEGRCADGFARSIASLGAPTSARPGAASSDRAITA